MTAAERCAASALLDCLSAIERASNLCDLADCTGDVVSDELLQAMRSVRHALAAVSHEL